MKKIIIILAATLTLKYYSANLQFNAANQCLNFYKDVIIY